MNNALHPDLEKAKSILTECDYTCVLCKGDLLYTATATGISPMLDFIQNDTDLKGFFVADKIVGKAVAMLFALSGIAGVYAKVISRAGLDTLNKHKIECVYDTLTDHIINREGTGICPMERTVDGIDDLKTGFNELLHKREFLRSLHKQKS